jgi:arginyl-tRNA synthetase
MTSKDIKKHILDITKVVVQKALGKPVNNLAVTYPPDVRHGDFSIEFFSVIKSEIEQSLPVSAGEVTKEERESRRKIVGALFQNALKDVARYVAEISADDVIDSVSVVNAYVNFKVKNNAYFEAIFSEAISQGDEYGKTMDGAGQRVMVEYLSPNTNKPLHLGHMRNGSLGMSIARILAFCGSEVVKANLVNDRGVHICKSMLAWQRFGNGETPKSTKTKGDHFVGEYYVLFEKKITQQVKIILERWLAGDFAGFSDDVVAKCIKLIATINTGSILENTKKANEVLKDLARGQTELTAAVHEMLVKWEEGNEDTINLWKMMNQWVYDGFTETYQRLGLEFDVFFYESNTYKLGKDVITAGLERGIFKKNDPNGPVVFQLPVSEFGTDDNGEAKRVTILRADGTSVYMTQDIGTALFKATEFNLDRSIYVVGSEQNHHFHALFTILKALGYSWASGCFHLSYGMVNLPEGKMKSREGTVVDADDLVQEVSAIVADEIKRRNQNISTEEIQKRASIIAVGAIKFHLLKMTPGQSIRFNPAESVSLEGFTGPYCQYSYVRAASILRVANASADEMCSIDYSVLGEREEIILAQKIMQFPEAVKFAAKELNPSRIASHVFDIAQAFNQFYNKHSVLNVEDDLVKKARIELVKATLIAISNGLHLLGIETVEEM